ncbi:CYTH and CHAD domain-containing protein [Arthrobacter silvisoli]|uniref:CYTH and CHAD domain-containing protein n=1 Tax=Arthrobacter silvisoli TaxID=2291022 RepID=UPI000E2142B4|nr:CYTH and CHAD domain-containing protein [Arthrobacter silvisoli]
MASAESTESERKYEPGPTARAPRFLDIPGVEHTGEPAEMLLEAVYFDTPDMELARRAITLRRRTGGPDDGWHLKLPLGPDDRQEIHAPLGQPDDVPPRLLERLAAFTRGRELSPTARLTTRRTTTRLYGPSGEHLADFSDDHVHAAQLRGPEPKGREQGAHWREWELELVHATPELFRAAEPVIAAAGARPAGHSSKVARALGDTWPAGTNQGPLRPRKNGPVRDVVLAYLDDRITEILANDAEVRREEPEALHHMRSAVRRTRSALAIYRPLFNKGAAARLEDELRWIGRVLGRPRDAEVLRTRILADLGGLPDEQSSGPVRGQIEHELGAKYDGGYRRALAALDSSRYFLLLDALEDFRNHPPAKAKAERKAGKASAKLINQAIGRLEKSERKARRTPDGPRHDKALHKIRKDAKRLRHGAETAVPFHGKAARKLRKSAHRLQEVLGRHQDAVIARELLAGFADAPDLSESSKAIYQHLARQEQDTAEQSQAAYEKTRKKVWKRRLGS